MQNSVGFLLRQCVKMGFQHVLLPFVYNLYRRRPVREGSVILADAHHDGLPFSMAALRRELYEYPEMEVREMFHDQERHGGFSNLVFMLEFMREYATTQTVVLCDNFLPVSACRKRKETKVIQLWHACGAFKKFGNDSSQDIPSFYRGSVTKNWNMVCVSSPRCVEPFAGAFGLDARRIRPVGVSRTDEYFSDEFRRMCRSRFLAGNPRAIGKKVVLWAPTFRGNAAYAGVEGAEGIRKAEKLLGEAFYFVCKLHPHSEKHLHMDTCSMRTEELLAAADVLVTDYSSVLFDAMACRLPIVLYAPDVEEYKDSRGFYLKYESIPAAFAADGGSLARVLADPDTYKEVGSPRYEAFYNAYMSGCDGKATKRILRQICSWQGKKQIPD